jgi:O-antigen/teichoic acid export membrane protein
MSRRAFQSGEHERRLAIGTVALQATQAVALVAALAITTLLGRRLSLAEFGTYGLIVAFAQVFTFAHVSVEQAAVERFARATGDAAARERVLAVVLVSYATIGAAAGVLVAGVGVVFAGPLGVPAELVGDARLGAVLVGVAIAVGWPVSASRDILRAEQLFRRVAVADSAGYALMAIATVLVVFVDGPLWALIGAGGCVTAFQGLVGLAFCLETGIAPRPARRLDRSELRGFAWFSGRLLATSATDVVVYSLDRLILSAFASVRHVALYEGPARVHQFVRVTTGSLGATVLPSATRFRAAGDHARTRDLLVRGTRYVLALVVPLVIAVCALAEPLLTAWLGERYASAAWALGILVSYWLVAANAVVASGMLVAHQRVGWLARYAWTVAAANLAASLVLTAAFGLEGVVLGTAIPYAVATPYFIVSAARFLGVPVRDLAREAWLPAYSTAAAMVVVMVAVRLAVDVDGLIDVAVVGLVAVALYWLAFAVVWMRPEERRLLGDVTRGMLRA